MRRLLVFALLLAPAMAGASADDPMITDPEGGVSRDPYAMMYWVPRPEVDVLWGDITVRDDVLDVAIGIVDLSAQTLPTQSTSYGFCWTTLPNNRSASIIHCTSGGRSLSIPEGWFMFTWFNSEAEGMVSVRGSFDDANSTIHIFAPRSHFASGDILQHATIWTYWNPDTHGAGAGPLVVGDRAPNEGWGRPMTIP